MDAGVMVVLATLGVVALYAVVAALVEWRHRRRARTQSRRARALLDAHAKQAEAASAAASAHRLASPSGRAGQPLDVVAAGDFPDGPAVTATHERRAS